MPVLTQPIRPMHHRHSAVRNGAIIHCGSSQLVAAHGVVKARRSNACAIWPGRYFLGRVDGRTHNYGGEIGHGTSSSALDREVVPWILELRRAALSARIHTRPSKSEVEASRQLESSPPGSMKPTNRTLSSKRQDA